MWKTHVDQKILAEYKKNGLLRSASHPHLPLTIWNYSAVCQYDKDKWDDITTLCRGLIIDSETSEIVGRSFRKFFNEGEKMHNPTDSFTVWEKMDGSLGILFNYRGQWIITSRGSFTSDQALKAGELLRKKYDISGLNKNTSYVFEIIYPTNRIVIDYGAEEELYFLAAFSRDGEEIWPQPLDEIRAAGFRVCPSYPEFTDYSQLQNLDWANHEGFVIRFSTGERMKIKFENYLQLHRMATSLSTTMVYDWFCEKKPLADLLEISPDEFHPWVREQWTALQTGYAAIVEELTAVVREKSDLGQKEFAQSIKDHPHCGLLFGIRNGKDIWNHVCKMVKPKANEKLQWSGAAGREKVEKRQQTITLTVGISGSGKSTWAKAQLHSQPNTVIVSRDAIREALFGYEPATICKYYESQKLQEREALVGETEMAQIAAAAAAGYDVIVDDTNLSGKTIRGFFAKFPQAQFNYKVFEIDPEEAFQRCSSRERKVAKEVIRSQFTKFKALLPLLTEIFAGSANPPILNDSTKPPAIIVDLDGTLAKITERNPYDWTRVEEDELNSAVYTTLRALRDKGYTVILCSGRSDEAREGTQRWLEKHRVPYDALHMRARNDTRPDYIVKEEMWREICEKFHIGFMLDDRDSVVSHARELGFTVFQVAPGNF